MRVKKRKNRSVSDHFISFPSLTSTFSMREQKGETL